MKNIALIVLIAIIGIAAWLTLKAKHRTGGVWRRFRVIWRQDPRIRETAIFSSALIISLIIFATLPGLMG